MDWQQISALVIVATAAVGLAWGQFRRRRASSGCDAHCGCASRATGNPEKMIFRARKGERSQVVVKIK